MVADTYELLKLFGMEQMIDPRDKMATLSVAQMQVIEILKAVSTKANVIILDEPTASLSVKEIETLFQIVRKLKAEGVGFIIVSHKINEIYEISGSDHSPAGRPPDPQGRGDGDAGTGRSDPGHGWP